jgi:hypothetical protein
MTAMNFNRPRPGADESAQLSAYIAALWPVMAPRDIASKLDLTLGAVTQRASAQGLEPRKAWQVPA